MDYEHIRCFSIHYIAKMGFVTQRILPGQWYGVSSIAHVLKRLNSTFRPLCDNFQVYVANDGNIFFEKIVKKMQKKIIFGKKT